MFSNGQCVCEQWKVSVIVGNVRSSGKCVYMFSNGQCVCEQWKVSVAVRNV